jgi:DNA-binding IclR family transcriptional regulator
MVLEGHRLVERSAESGRYRLGLRLFELGSRASSTLDLREHSRPHLSRVLSETQETVHFCVLDEGEALYLEKMEPQRSVRMASSIGRRAPVHCTAVGKAMLAALPEAEVDLVLRRHGMKALTRHTVTDAADLKAQLKLIRSRGYAIDDEENEEGVRCVAAAVRDCLGRAVAAISVSGPSFRMTRNNVPVMAKSAHFQRNWVTNRKSGSLRRAARRS